MKSESWLGHEDGGGGRAGGAPGGATWWGRGAERAGATVRYGPAAATPDAYSGYLDLVVPVRATAAGPRTGTSVFALKVETAAGTVSERLKLVCRPTFP